MLSMSWSLSLAAALGELFSVARRTGAVDIVAAVNEPRPIEGPAAG